MRTGLITFHFAHHYGAQLQALATMRAIQSLGHDCEIIDYRLPHTTRTNQLFKKSGGVRGMASDAHTALHYGAFQRRFRRFEAFVAEEMALSPRRYTAFEQLRADPPAYDVYVAGSDQIWNPYIFQDKQFDPSFLLGFVREGRRIAYAPSLGVPELPEDKAEELRRFLTPFSALSVREKRGQVLLREAAGRDARVVLDPTLLLTGEDWGELAAAPKRQGPYILCYFVSDPGEAVPYALALSARTGWPIVQLAGARRKIDGAAELVFDAGPREFLGLFRHASAVVTNSFHGAAFSLQFQKDFFTSMSPRERAEPTFSRIYSLLSRLGCADRILGLDTTAPVDAPIDYGAVYEKLAAARADSLSYLGAAIEGAPLPAKEPEPQAAPRPVLCRAEDCTGCTACASVCPVNAIAMEPDHEGFLRPVIGERCILCHRCEQTCPILHPPVPGPAPAAAHAVWNRDEAERTASSSGGFFSLLARHVLEQGGAVFGAALDEDMTARHVCARTVDELAPMRGSKYVQSDLGGSFSQVKALLEEGTAVLFSGVPCQVDGLKRYLGKDYPNLLTCDLVCHGGLPGLPGRPGGRPRLQGCLGALQGQVPRLVSPLVHRSVCRWERLYRGLQPHRLWPGLRDAALPAPRLRPVPVHLHQPPRRLHPGRLLGPGREAGPAGGAGQGGLHGAGELRPGAGCVRCPLPPVRPGGAPPGRGGGGQPPAGLPPEGQPPPGRLLCRLRCPALRRGGKALSGPPLPALPGGGQGAHPGHEGKNPQAAEITAAKCLQFIREFFPAVWYTTLYVTTGRAFRPTGGNFT